MRSRPESSIIEDAGSAAEFERIFTNNYRSVYCFFLSQGVSPTESHDLTQETFLRVYKGMSQFRGETTFRQWILLIALNVWKNELRRLGAAKREVTMISLEELTGSPGEGPRDREPPEPGASGRPVEGLLASERVERLHEALRALPSQMRRCAVLRFAQELSYREIAAVMRISIETVKSQIFQARQRLQSALDDG